MRNEKTRDENMHTKKCTTKKGWTKNQPVTTYHAFGNVVFPRVSQNLPDQPFGEKGEKG